MRTTVTALLALFLVGLTLPATAQTNWKNQIAVTGGAQFPAGNFGDAWKTGSGLDLTYYYRPSTHFFLGFQGGYHRFKSKTPVDRTLGIIPIHVASKYNFALTGLQPYIGVDGGLYIFDQDGPDNESEFGIGPKFGLRIPIATGVDIDLNATYEVIFDDPENRTYVGVNAGIAYIFGS